MITRTQAVSIINAAAREGADIAGLFDQDIVTDHDAARAKRLVRRARAKARLHDFRGARSLIKKAIHQLDRLNLTNMVNELQPIYEQLDSRLERDVRRSEQRNGEYRKAA